MFGKNIYGNLVLLLVMIFVISLFSTEAQAEPVETLSTGGTVYVSIYSNVYSGPKALAVQLAAMLSIRNTDPKFPITILSADYYDSSGKLVKKYISKPTIMKPLESIYHYIKGYDTSGGPGANFLVKWRAENKVNKPIIEGIMTNTNLGLSYRSPGQEITEH